MPNVTASRVRSYLDDLERALSGLPKDRRTEIVRDIRSHIDVALADRGDATAADVEQLLDELGTPAEIAEAAYAELPPRPRAGISGRDAFTVVAVLLGGFVFLVGWLVGIALLWMSNTWSIKDKVVATLLVPGGLATAAIVGLGGMPSSVTTCTSSAEVATASGSSSVGQAAINHCTSSGAGPGTVIVGLIVLAITVLGPIYTAAMLTTAARRAA